MTTIRAIFGALAMSVGLGAACTPSTSAGRAARASADSATEVAGAAENPAPDATQDLTPLTAQPVLAPAPLPPPAPPPPSRAAARPVLLPPASGPYRVRIVDESHHDFPTFASGGRTYVMGTVGARYSVMIANPTGRRVEAVVSIDGLDAMDGQPANYVEKRGYILPAYGDATIDGFRTSLSDVATFRFSSVAESYAGRLGQARDVGVVGVAFFPERVAVAVRPPFVPDDGSSRRHYRPTPAAPRAQSLPAPAPPASRPALADQPYGGGGAGGGGVSDQSATRAAPSAHGRPGEEKADDRPGLGTEFGEARESPIEMVQFLRANPVAPSQLFAIRYNDRAGLIALGIAIPQPYATADTDRELRETAEPFRQNRFAQPPP